MTHRDNLLTSTAYMAPKLAASYVNATMAKLQNQHRIERNLKAAGIVLPPKPELIL